jgi:hypothetical protein
MHTKEDVAQLVAHIGELKIDPPVEIETSMFGLAAHLYDPITGKVMTLADPFNSDRVTRASSHILMALPIRCF